MQNIFEQLRLRIANDIDLEQLAAAALAVLIAYAIGYAVARFVAPRIAHAIEHHDIQRGSALLKAAATVGRYLLAALLLLAVKAAYPWHFHAAFLLSFFFALALALGISRLLRALRIGFWTATAAATALFIMLFSEVFGGVESVATLLDKAGFAVGTHRFSLLTITKAVLVGIFIIAGVRLCNALAKALLGRNRRLDETQRLLVEKLVMVGLIIAAFFIGIDMLGIDLTALAVFSGAFGLAIGFGLQKTFGNLIAGILLLMDRSIKPGDVIVVGNDVGWVNKIGIRAVSVLTRDGKEHLIPNENLMTNEVENWSYSSRNVRVRIPVGVSYSADMDQVEKLLLQAASESSRVLETPPPNVWMAEFGDSSVNFEILAWIGDPEGGIGNVRSDVLKRVWRLFKEHDVEIPFPQRDLNLRSLAPDVLDALAEKQVAKTAKPEA